MMGGVDLNSNVGRRGYSLGLRVAHRMVRELRTNDVPESSCEVSAVQIICVPLPQLTYILLGHWSVDLFLASTGIGEQRVLYKYINVQREVISYERTWVDCRVVVRTRCLSPRALVQGGSYRSRADIKTEVRTK
jgi:hypothetical protein